MEEKYNKSLGHGRSACVYLIEKDDKKIARKVFTGTDLTNFILTIFYGSPLDYQWCRPAIDTTLYRRKVLKSLLKFWYDEKITIAEAYSVGLKEDSKEYYLDTEFIKGEPAKMHNSFATEMETEYDELKNEILEPLQQKLMNSGMIGTVWQAGYGQPCAIPNFLKSKETGKWVWIDAESGVPAIVSYNPVKLLKYYIPKAIKQGRVMFDDIDAKAFQKYCDENADGLKESLGQKEFAEFAKNVEKLLEAHKEWGKENRFSRALQYFKFKGKITEEKYEFYKKHFLRWYIFLILRFFQKDFGELFTHTCRKLWKYAKVLNPIRHTLFILKSMILRKYRIETSTKYITTKIKKWNDDNRLSDKQKDTLLKELENDETNQYLSDFGVFILFKPLAYIIRGIIIFILYPMGILDLYVGGIIIGGISVVLRGGYALYRFIEDAIRYRRFSWVALVVAPMPMVGTLAHPCQMLHSARQDQEIAKFIIFEIFSKIARKIPIFGGEHSEIEYFLNSLAFRLIKFAV